MIPKTAPLRSLPLILLALMLGAACAACASPAAESGPAGSATADSATADNATADSATDAPQAAAPAIEPGPDPHSFARPAEAAVRHIELILNVDFAERVLTGRATLELERTESTERVILDTTALTIESVRYGDGSEASYRLGREVELLGRPLIIDLRPEDHVVHVEYRTDPAASALQWLTPQQTAGGDDPYLFTQSQAILARSWIPLQDTPGVRFTYRATVNVPPRLMAVMSAANGTRKDDRGIYHFKMDQPIPSYLMALAVGDLAYRDLGPRSGVYSEPEMIERAAAELVDTEAMIDAAEALYGPYRWKRYDLLILPPSFPYGGMENPRLTFATPTIIAGDRSLVALVAHELAHSWSGNLVTNADWDDFWLNEGFTVYFEQRIMEQLYGREYSEMLAQLSRQGLEEEMAELAPADTHLHLDLAGRDPDEDSTGVPYDKGYLFLRALEEAVGRERWDAFLRDYFDEHAFQTMTSQRFLEILQAKVTGPQGEPVGQLVDLDAWVYGPGLPPGAPEIASARLARVDEALAAWGEGQPAAELPDDAWSTHETLHFLRNLPDEIDRGRLAELDRELGLTGSGNSEILAAWLEVAVEQGYEPAYGALEEFLLEVGRRKFLRPLYGALAETEAGKARARAIYERARPGYHPVSQGSIDAILGWQDGG